MIQKHYTAFSRKIRKHVLNGGDTDTIAHYYQEDKTFDGIVTDESVARTVLNLTEAEIWTSCCHSMPCPVTMRRFHYDT